MNEKLKEYIKRNLENDSLFKEKDEKEYESYNTFMRETIDEAFEYEKTIEVNPCFRKQAKRIDQYIQDSKTDYHFQELLFHYIDERELKDSDVYNKVNIDRRLFSKIRSDANYHPSKETVILLGISLKLSEEEIEKLLNSASYSLPKNNVYDLIIRFCFIEGIYNLDTINEYLDEYNCKLLV